MVSRAFLIITRTRHRHSLSSWFPIMSGTENNDLATAKSPVYHESVNRIRSIPAASRSFLVFIVDSVCCETATIPNCTDSLLASSTAFCSCSWIRFFIALLQ